MVRSFIAHAQRLLVVLTFLIFVWAAIGGAQFGSPVVEKGPSSSPVCDIYTPVTDAACSQAGTVLLLVSLLLGAALLRRTASVSLILHPAVSLWRLYLFAYFYTNALVLLPLKEAFRRGIIHPKIYYLSN